MSTVMIARGKTTGGNTTIEWALAPKSEPETIDFAQVGDMRFSLIRVDGVLHIDINERLTCGSDEQAVLLFNSLVGEEAERQQVTVGGPGESIELSEISF